jgi:hypothetical protein
MFNRWFTIILVTTFCFNSSFANEKQGKAAKEGVSATALTWGILGVSLLVAIGIVVAISLSSNNDKTVIVVHQ